MSDNNSGGPGSPLHPYLVASLMSNSTLHSGTQSPLFLSSSSSHSRKYRDLTTNLSGRYSSSSSLHFRLGFLITMYFLLSSLQSLSVTVDQSVTHFPLLILCIF